MRCCSSSETSAATSAATEAACTLLRIAEHERRGRVRWLGLWWIGVPAPKRVQLIWREARTARRGGRRVSLAQMRRAYGRLDGCGCIDVLKRAWERLGSLRRARG